MINQMIIGTSFLFEPPSPPWPPGTDPNGGIAEIPGIAQLGFWKRTYLDYYFNDDIAGLLAATPSASEADTSFQINNIGDIYSVMWTGYLQAPAGGTFKFRTNSDDCSYFWIGTDATTSPSISNVDINNGGLHGTVGVESDYIELTNGLYYPIRAMFGEQYGGDVFYMEWNFENEGWVPFNMAYARYNADNSVDGY